MVSRLKLFLARHHGARCSECGRVLTRKELEMNYRLKFHLTGLRCEDCAGVEFVERGAWSRSGSVVRATPAVSPQKPRGGCEK